MKKEIKLLGKEDTAPQGVEYLKKATEMGNPHAALELGIFLYTHTRQADVSANFKINEDFPEYNHHFEYLEKAVDLGIFEAKNLGSDEKDFLHGMRRTSGYAGGWTMFTMRGMSFDLALKIFNTSPNFAALVFLSQKIDKLEGSQQSE